MRFNVDIATAAMIIAAVVGGARMPETAMAEGGYPQPSKPVLVGERGSEVFVPDVPGTVAPLQPLPPMKVLPPGTTMKADPNLVPAHATDYYDALGGHGMRLNEDAWGQWLANAPMSENIEDRRDLDAIDMGEIYWRSPRGDKGQLIQFRPAETHTHAKSTTPDWLKDQESQWLKANKKHSPSTAKQ